MNRFINNLSEISNHYDLFIFDIWGVLHNGKSLYPDIINTFQTLASLNKTVALLSNSPKIGKQVALDLKKLKLPSNLYTKIYTAGDNFFHYLNTTYNKNSGSWFVLDHSNVSTAKTTLIENKLTVSDDFYDAKNILIASIDESDLNLSHYKNLVDFCTKTTPNIYSMNPDTHVITPKGMLARPGLLTKHMKKLGLTVIEHGKPSKKIFGDFLQKFKDHSSQRTVMLGDSLNTDIQGARNANLDSVLIYGAYPPKEALAHYSIQINKPLPLLSHPSINSVKDFIHQSEIQPTFYLSEVKI